MTNLRKNIDEIKKYMAGDDMTSAREPIREIPVINLDSVEGNVERKIAETQMLLNKLARDFNNVIDSLNEVRITFIRCKVATGVRVGDAEDKLYYNSVQPSVGPEEAEKVPDMTFEFKREKKHGRHTRRRPKSKTGSRSTSRRSKKVESKSKRTGDRK